MQICTQEACIGKATCVVCNSKILETTSISLQKRMVKKIIENADTEILSNYKKNEVMFMYKYEKIFRTHHYLY